MKEVSISLLSVMDKINSSRFFLDFESAKVDYFHIDVMDGKFVEKNTAVKMKELANTAVMVSNVGIDVHLMVENVRDFIEEYVSFRPKIISFHKEATKSDDEMMELINIIKGSGSMVGIAISPDTNVEELYPFLKYIHVALIMSVYPGKGGQDFIEDSFYKISKLKKYIEDNNLDTLIEVDGGIDGDNCEKVSNSGADILVSGSYPTLANDYIAAVKRLKNC